MERALITSSQCKNARRALTLSQSQLSKKSGKSLSYIKQFETGRFNPGEDFQRGLVSYFEGEGLDLSEFGDPDAPETAPPGQPSRPPVRRPCFYAAPGILAADLETLLETIERSFERLDAMLSKPVERGFFGLSEASNKTTHDVFSELALIGVTYAAIAGRISVRPMLIAEPKTQVEYVASFLADARGDKASDTEGDDTGNAADAEEAA